MSQCPVVGLDWTLGADIVPEDPRVRWRQAGGRGCCLPANGLIRYLNKVKILTGIKIKIRSHQSKLCSGLGDNGWCMGMRARSDVMRFSPLEGGAATPAQTALSCRGGRRGVLTVMDLMNVGSGLPQKNRKTIKKRQ